MSDHLGAPPVQLLLYAFGADARFEGRLAGALERMESGGTLRILEALFVRNNAETGEPEAVDLRSRGAGSMVMPLVGFRLDPAERARASKRALAADDALGDTLRQLGAELAPGAAVAAVLVEHTWARTLEDAVSASAGTRVSSEFVNGTSLAELAPLLLAAARHNRPGAAVDASRDAAP
jgi:hypothetical protein